MKLGTKQTVRNKKSVSARTYPRPAWVPKTVVAEEELCPDCFKVVGDKSRYKLVCMLGKTKNGMTVTELTENVALRQPTVTHHLQILKSVGAVTSNRVGREHIYQLKKDAHCFEECNIPF